MFDSAFPIISTPNLAGSLGFYRGLLDGTVSFRIPPEGEPGYVGIEIGSSHLGIGLDPTIGGGAEQRRVALWVYADDCDAAIQRLRRSGAPIIEEPEDQPWGERVARVHDPTATRSSAGHGRREIVAPRPRPLRAAANRWVGVGPPVGHQLESDEECRSDQMRPTAEGG